MLLKKQLFVKYKPEITLGVLGFEDGTFKAAKV